MKTYIYNIFIGIFIVISLISLLGCIDPLPSITEDILDNNNDNENQEQGIPEHEKDQTKGDQQQSSKDEKPSSNEEEPKNATEKDTLLKARTNLNIRSLPNATSAIVGSIIPDAMVPYVEQTNANWYKTIYKGKTAYISAKYCDIVYFNTASSAIEKVINKAKQLLGYPYIYGAQRYHWGNGILNYNFVMGEFDCSSLTQYSFYQGVGILLDLTTRTQVYQGIPITNKNDIQRGDLMFFTNASRRHLSGTERVGHVAIYLGDNYILHTASTYAIIEPISTRRWNDYITSRRFL